MTVPSYDLEKLKFGIDETSFQKAVGLYEGGKVKNFQDTGFTYVGTVQGTQLYNVIVSKKRYTDGDCTCYLGQNDTLCKHIIAVELVSLVSSLAQTSPQSLSPSPSSSVIAA